MSSINYQRRRLTDVLIIILKIINALIICYAGYLLTVRVFPRLYTSADATGQDYIKELQRITNSLSDTNVKDPGAQKLKDKTIEAISLISNSFIDNKNAVEDADKRTKRGIFFLVFATFIQSIFLIFTK